MLQTSLSDFYVEYTLNFRPEEPAQRVFVLSALRTNIQDAFNENGVQILSPTSWRSRRIQSLVPT